MSESKQAEIAKYDVGDDRQPMTVKEIAEAAGVSVQAIRHRISTGVTGEDLLKPAEDRAAGGRREDDGWALFRKRWAEWKADPDPDTEDLMQWSGCTREEAEAHIQRFVDQGYRNDGKPILPNGRAPDWLPPWTLILKGRKR